MKLTVEQVTGLAPDAAAAKTGRGLAVERKWAQSGRFGEALWGLCEGSGAKPYQVRIDLTGPAYKCSCPSFKIPCKHCLGLMFLCAEKPALFAEDKPCDFLTEWLDDRQKRAEQKAQKEAEKASAAPADPETLARRESAQLKRAASREEKVAAGIAELSLFINDLARQGLASLSSKPFSFWDNQAARLVDAQATGLARQVSELGSACSSGDGWQERFLHRLARIHLACEAWSRQTTLSAPLLADLRAVVGFSTPQEEVLGAAGCTDDWFVLAQIVSQEEKVRLARTWYWGATSRRAAIVYHYAYAGQPLETRRGPGSALRAELAFFPSAAPWRALEKEPATTLPFARPAGLAGIDEMLASFAATLAANPWADRRAYLLDQVLPLCDGSRWRLQDTSPAGIAVPLHAQGDSGWKLPAISGGQPVAVFGEWDGRQFEPLSVFDAQGCLHNLAPKPAPDEA